MLLLLLLLLLLILLLYRDCCCATTADTADTADTATLQLELLLYHYCYRCYYYCPTVATASTIFYCHCTIAFILLLLLLR